jgi:hypothetical protein
MIGASKPGPILGGSARFRPAKGCAEISTELGSCSQTTGQAAASLNSVEVERRNSHFDFVHSDLSIFRNVRAQGLDF